MTPLLTDEPNALPRFSNKELGRPLRFLSGQVWTLRNDLTDWSNPHNLPPLFPVVILDDKLEYLPGRIPARTVVPVHDLRENIASDDLLCTPEDGPLAKNGSMLAAWAKTRVFEGHLDGYLGIISKATRNRLVHLVARKSDSGLRRFTGSSIILPTDPRREYRTWLSEGYLRALAGPVEQFTELFERITMIAARVDKAEMQRLLEEIGTRVMIEGLCEAVKGEVVFKAGAGSMEKITADSLIDRQLGKFKATYGTNTPETFNHVIRFLLTTFRDTLRRYPLDCLARECDQWKRRAR